MDTSTKTESASINTNFIEQDEVPVEIARKIADQHPWTDFIACSLVNAALFDEVPNQKGPSKQRRIDAAMVICEQCPVKLWCSVEQMNGTNISGDNGDIVRGGTLGFQRAEYRRKVASQLGLKGAKASDVKFRVVDLGIDENESGTDEKTAKSGHVAKKILPV